MKPTISDPDKKINMSLDEIIRLSRGEDKCNVPNKRTTKKKKKGLKNGDPDHSVPLFTSKQGVSVLVSKRSPLLNSDAKQSFLKAVTNRALNADLLNKSTKIIPAKYKLIKTDKGVEKILVPVKNYTCEPPRKLHRDTCHFDKKKSPSDDIPSLLSLPVAKPVRSPFDALKQKLDSSMKMEIDDDDESEVVILNCLKKEPELIDVEMNMPLIMSESSPMRTLNDRFTRLTGSFQF